MEGRVCLFNTSFYFLLKGGVMSREGDFQSHLREEIEKRFPGSIVLRNDPSWLQGIPDLLIVYRDKWAALECKREEKGKHRPNQDYYVNLMNDMSYSSFVYPENEELVLDELQQAFGS